MKEDRLNEIKDELDLIIYKLKNDACNVDTKEKGWETYYGLDDTLIDYIRKIEKENKELQWLQKHNYDIGKDIDKEARQLQERIDKAIEYINNASYFDGSSMCANDLVEILGDKGEDK